MKQFLGLVSLQVGISTLAATFMMLALTMISVNMWSVAGGNTKACMVLVLLIILMLVTWVIAYIGSYESSLSLMSTALKFWKIFLMLWLILTVWSLFFANKGEINGGFTCLNSRCVPSCFLLKYDNKWTNSKNDSSKNDTATSTAATTTNTTNLFILNDLLLNSTIDKEFPLFKEDIVQSDESTIFSENVIESIIEDEDVVLAENISHEYHDANDTSEFQWDKINTENKIRLKRKTPNSDSNERNLKSNTDVGSLRYIIVAVSGSLWDIVIVPSIFFILFMFAKSTLDAYTLELKINMQYLSDRC